MTPTVAVVASDIFASTAAALIAELVEAATASRGACSIALCGGSTPVPVYRDLIGRRIDWSKVAIFFGDERAVSPDHPDSNYAMARRELLDHLARSPAQVHRMAADRDDIDVAAREYDRILPPRFDVLLLGVGSDGHTASLFPGSRAVTEPSRRVLAVPSPPLPLTPQVPRMTITPLVLAAARHVIVLVQGSEKAAILQRILDGPDQPTLLPAQLARSGTWIVDRAAAAHLQSRDN